VAAAVVAARVDNVSAAGEDAAGAGVDSTDEVVSAAACSLLAEELTAGSVSDRAGPTSGGTLAAVLGVAAPTVRRAGVATSVTGAVTSVTLEVSDDVAPATVEVATVTTGWTTWVVVSATGATAEVAVSTTGCTTSVVTAFTGADAGGVPVSGATVCVTGAASAETDEVTVETGPCPVEEPVRAAVVPPSRPSARAEGANAADRAAAAATTSARRFMPRP
jgi:hypothetical protein